MERSKNHLFFHDVTISLDERIKFREIELKKLKDKQKVKFENLIDGIPSEIDSDLESSPSKKDIP